MGTSRSWIKSLKSICELVLTISASGNFATCTWNKQLPGGTL